MSIFYLTPVKGNIQLHLLEEVIVKRLQYLRANLNGDPVQYNEYVVDGSIYDNVGHFMLCSVAVLTDNRGFMQFYLRSEVNLFKRRLSALSAYDMRNICKRVCRSLKKYDHDTHLHPLKVLCQHLMLKHMAHHVCSVMHMDECCEHYISLHFKYCLGLVAKRQVGLNNGIAMVPCGRWKPYLIELFKHNVKFKMNQVDSTELRSDPRMAELLLKIKIELPFSKNIMEMLTSKEVDQASVFFPPCMRNLHASLRIKHRLSHTHRFHYSLFLKDIGLPVEEAIEFWRAEYSQSTNGVHSCCHNWSKDEKKFVYGIRHMYGLEGARKGYASVNCSRIQAENNFEGGCPFKCFDDSKMNELLDHPSENMKSQINELKRKRQYTSACMMFLRSKCSNPDFDDLSFNFTPVKYYTLAKKC